MPRVAIVNDYATDDVEQEQQEILENLSLYLSDIEFVIGSASFTEELLSRSFDVLILDYGGVSAGAQGLVDFQIRTACKWAEEHPNKLLILWTDHTAWEYEQGLKEEFPDLANIFYRFGQPFSYSADNSDETFGKAVRLWFGQTEPPTQEPMPKLMPPKSRK